MSHFDWHNDRSGVKLLDSAPESVGISLKSLRLYRLDRVRKEMQKRDIGELILSDPVSIRYASGTRNMQVFSSRNTPSLYLFVYH